MKRRNLFAAPNDDNIRPDLMTDNEFNNERDEDEAIIEDNEVDDDFYSSEKF